MLQSRYESDIYNQLIYLWPQGISRTVFHSDLLYPPRQNVDNKSEITYTMISKEADSNPASSEVVKVENVAPKMDFFAGRFGVLRSQ